jgi:hypothetical protein
MFPANTVLIALYGATIGKLGILSGHKSGVLRSHSDTSSV